MHRVRQRRKRQERCRQRERERKGERERKREREREIDERFPAVSLHLDEPTFENEKIVQRPDETAALPADMAKSKRSSSPAKKKASHIPSPGS